MNNENRQYDYYILKMVGCVEPILVGPLETEEQTHDRMVEYQSDPSESQNSHIIVKVSEGSEVELW